MAWSKETRIITMLAIDIVFFAVELTSGFMLHSLALMADAFHMLNDIISLFIGLWAVRAAQKASDDKYSYGYLRAEILGAFFNAVFLIALCVSIVLEALGRLIEPSEISNPQVMLIVGSFGLASNLVGFLVLGSHGHSHGPGNGYDHDHDHDHEHAPGEAHSHNDPHNSSHDHAHDHSHSHSDATRSAEEGTAGYGATSRSHIHNHKRLTSIEDLSIHPASFRHDILTVSRKIEEPLETSSTDSDNDATATESQPTESTSLLRPGVAVSTDISSHKHTHTHTRSRRDSEIIHSAHNHNKPRSATSSHSHSHNHDDMGMNAMVLHVLGDALGNVGVIVTALVIWLTEWRYKLLADPLVSLFITAIILYSALPLTYATSKVLLQATPDHLNVNEIREDIETLPGVVSCHHIHIWQLSDTKVVASMHMQVAFPMSEAGGEKYMELARRARKCLHAYGIHSATIQPEYCLDPEHAADHEQLAREIHAQGGSSNYDGLGLSSPPQRGDVCLLECVDNCVGKGCCPSPSAQQSPVLSRSSSLSGQSRGRGHSDHQH
ncbi:Zinc resistance conferring protein [Ceratocystis pirilliformis]|uniref:Zinc resistance conferring protein n=1 Tax=Ceratocystis pirilliformis TaxID=259994 RepID=A0ABR3YZ95_9PEZI